MGHVSRPKPGHVTAHAFGGRLVASRREQIAMAGEAHRLDDRPAPGSSRWRADCGTCRTTDGRRFAWRTGSAPATRSGSPPAACREQHSSKYVTKTLSAAWPAWKSHQSRPGFSIRISPFQVALLAYAVATARRLTWPDSRWNPRRGSSDARQASRGTVAGDRREGRILELVLGSRSEVHGAGVAEEASAGDLVREIEMWFRLVARCQVPALGLCVVRNRRLKQVVALAEPCNCSLRCRPPPNKLRDILAITPLRSNRMLHQRAARMDG